MNIDPEFEDEELDEEENEDTFDFEEDILENEVEEEEEDASFNQKEGIEEKSNHKKYKKHSLKYDTIFKGKKETLDEEELDDADCMLVPDRIEIMHGTIVYEESRNPEEYNRLKKLTEAIYDILLNNTELNFKKNRRKPSPKDFNRYFEVIKENINDKAFSDCDIFVELSYYFSENLFNMFKLLEPEKGSKIMRELKEYMSKKKGTDIDDIDFI